jgi:hypothetical protein
MNETKNTSLIAAIEELKKSPGTIAAIQKYRADHPEKYKIFWMFRQSMDFSVIMNDPNYCGQGCSPSLLARLATELSALQLKTIEFSVISIDQISAMQNYYEIGEHTLKIFIPKQITRP